jgi:hypothetical protein
MKYGLRNCAGQTFLEPRSLDPKAWLCELILPHWAKDRSPDRNHPHKRRFTGLYRRKKCIVRNLWIGSGLLMIVVATPALILAMTLATTFLSFVILDETT